MDSEMIIRIKKNHRKRKTSEKVTKNTENTALSSP